MTTGVQRAFEFSAEVGNITILFVLVPTVFLN